MFDHLRSNQQLQWKGIEDRPPRKQLRRPQDQLPRWDLQREESKSRKYFIIRKFSDQTTLCESFILTCDAVAFVETSVFICTIAVGQKNWNAGVDSLIKVTFLNRAEVLVFKESQNQTKIIAPLSRRESHQWSRSWGSFQWLHKARWSGCWWQIPCIWDYHTFTCFRILIVFILFSRTWQIPCICDYHTYFGLY